MLIEEGRVFEDEHPDSERSTEFVSGKGSHLRHSRIEVDFADGLGGIADPRTGGGLDCAGFVSTSSNDVGFFGSEGEIVALIWDEGDLLVGGGNPKGGVLKGGDFGVVRVGEFEDCVAGFGGSGSEDDLSRVIEAEELGDLLAGLFDSLAGF